MEYNNEVIKAIKSRRSIRSFLPKPVEEEKIKIIIESAIYAPSAMNGQPWFFTILQDEEIIKKINEEIKNIILNTAEENFRKRAEDESFNVFHGADTLIIVSGKEDAKFSHVDCAAATQNILLSAYSLNLATCWIGSFAILLESPKVNEFLELLKIPKGYKPLWAVALGYTENLNIPPRERKNNVYYWIK